MATANDMTQEVQPQTALIRYLLGAKIHVSFNPDGVVLRLMKDSSGSLGINQQSCQTREAMD